MPSAPRKKTAARPSRTTSKNSSSRARPPPKKPASKPAPKPIAKASKPPAKKARPVAPADVPLPPPPPIRLPGGRRHLLSLSFLRDGDEFLARMETDAGQITELKNRSLDQLLTLVASELEDLLE